MATIVITRGYINGNFRILKWRYCTIFLAIFCGDIPLHRPKNRPKIYGIGTSNQSDPGQHGHWSHKHTSQPSYFWWSIPHIYGIYGPCYLCYLCYTLGTKKPPNQMGTTRQRALGGDSGRSTTLGPAGGGPEDFWRRKLRLQKGSKTEAPRC